MSVGSGLSHIWACSYVKAQSQKFVCFFLRTCHGALGVPVLGISRATTIPDGVDDVRSGAELDESVIQ